MLIDFKDEDFENKIKNEDVSVIQFSAAWCGPCKAIAAVIEEIASEYENRVKVGKVDVILDDLNQGEYFVQVTDFNNCFVDSSFLISQPLAPVAAVVEV